jgi:hypothetical protein
MLEQQRDAIVDLHGGTQCGCNMRCASARKSARSPNACQASQ